MKNLLRKILVPLTALSMILGMTALASPEGPSVPGVNPGGNGSAEDPDKPDNDVEGKVVINGQTYSMVMRKVSADVQAEVSTQEKVIALMGSSYKAGTELQFLAMVDAALPVGVSIPEGESVRITFDVPNVKAGDVVRILHKSANGWETHETTTGDGTVASNFSDLSPVLFYRVVAKQNNVNNDIKSYDPNKSPRTGRQ